MVRLKASIDLSGESVSVESFLSVKNIWHRVLREPEKFSEERVRAAKILAERIRDAAWMPVPGTIERLD